MAEVNDVVTIEYNNAMVSLQTGQTATLPCKGKTMNADLVVSVLSGMIATSGTLTITENGTYDVKGKASVLVECEVVPAIPLPKYHFPFDDASSEGKVGNAINLKDDPYSTNYSQPDCSFSASFWIKIPDTTVALDEAPIFTNKDWDSGLYSGYIFFIGYKDRNNNPNEGVWLKFNVGNGNDRSDVLTQIPESCLNGEWFHVTVVVDRTQNQVRTSFNFGEFATLGSIIRDGFDGDKLCIGKDVKSNYRFTRDVYMDDFMFFDKALTDADVASLEAYYTQAN